MKVMKVIQQILDIEAILVESKAAGKILGQFYSKSMNQNKQLEKQTIKNQHS